MEKKTDFKSLTTKAKIGYIWDYYRFHILGTVLAVVILFSVIHHFVSYREPLLNVIMTNAAGGQYTSADGFDSFLDAYGYNKKEHPISLSASLTFEERDTATMDTYTNYEVLGTMMAAGGQDLFFGNNYVFLEYADQGAFLDLSTVLSPELLEKYQDHLIYPTIDGTAASYPCAVELTGNQWLQDNGYYEGSCYFGIIRNTEHLDACVQFANFLLEQ